MTLLRRLAIRAARELARRPEVRAKAKETLTNATRVFNEEVKPRSKDAWRDAQPDIEHAKAGDVPPDVEFWVAAAPWPA